MTAKMGEVRRRLRANTPYKMRKLGNAIVIGAVPLQAAVVAIPLDPLTQGLVQLGIAFIVAIGKVITELFTEEDYQSIIIDGR